jgi:hypothetical protein
MNDQELADLANAAHPSRTFGNGRPPGRPPIPLEMKVPALVWVLLWVSAVASAIFIVEQLYFVSIVMEIRDRIEKVQQQQQKPSERMFKSDVERLHDKGNIFQP